MAAYKGVVPSGKYTFNATAKTITLDADYTGIALSDIMLITNVKSGTAISIYDPFDPTKGGTLSTLTLTLNYNTTSMSNSDPLQIIIGMTTLPTALPTGAATETTLSSINTKTPSLGQALAAGSVPVVLTAAQLTTLTPLSSVSVSNFPATQPVSGSVSITGSVAVTGTFWQATQPVSLASVPTHPVTQSGTWTVATNADGTTGFSVPSKGLLVQGSDGTNARNLSTTTAGILKVDLSGTTANSTAIKVDGSAVTQPVSGTVTANISGSISNTTFASTQSGTWTVGLSAGSNAIGSITNTSFAATQSTAANLNATVVGTGTFAVQAAQSGTWNITNISGTVSLPTGAATEATLTAGTQRTKITDGTNNAAVKAASTAPLATDPALVVAISPNSSLPVSGTVTANAGTNLNTSALALETGGNLATIKTNTDNLALAQGSTTSGQKGNLAMASVSSSAPAPTTGTTQALSLTTAGELRIGSDGCTAYQAVSASTTNLALIKAGSTKVYGWYIYNNSTNIKKVILYDSATSGAITVGTTTPLVTLVIPASSGANVSLPIPLAVTNGLCIAMTGGTVGSTTMQNSDATAVSANDLNVNILYK